MRDQFFCPAENCRANKGGACSRRNARARALQFATVGNIDYTNAAMGATNFGMGMGGIAIVANNMMPDGSAPSDGEHTDWAACPYRDSPYR